MEYEHLDLRDFAVIAWDWINRTVLGIVLLPFIILWYILPTSYLVIFLIRGDQFGWKGTRALLVAIYLFWASKYLITPQLLLLLPEINMDPLYSNRMYPSLVPLLTLSLSVTLMSVYRRLTGRLERGLFGRFMSLTLTDATISMLIYAIGSFG
jgi:hypothetical protein